MKSETSAPKKYTVVCSYLQGIHSKTPCGRLKPQIAPTPTYTVFPIYTYLCLIYKLDTEINNSNNTD